MITPLTSNLSARIMGEIEHSYESLLASELQANHGVLRNGLTYGNYNENNEGSVLNTDVLGRVKTRARKCEVNFVQH